MTELLARLRVDKWLWAARFYKTRALAAAEVERGRVLVAGNTVKTARELKVGDVFTVRQGPVTRQVVVRAISAVRGPAPVAQMLYEETPASIAAREQAAAARRLSPETAQAIAHGRPTKRDRRALEAQRRGKPDRTHAPVDWDDRWSASLDRP